MIEASLTAAVLMAWLLPFNFDEIIFLYVNVLNYDLFHSVQVPVCMTCVKHVQDIQTCVKFLNDLVYTARVI